ncbi:hypothetical protein [Nocardia sp. NBC_00511]|uniref:hypothetical protein n=1 Tax=Nocardia sp. NBC_00511 TaxID=2903591 RepID=UPI0030E146B0
MSDREQPGRGSLPGPGENRFDAVERLRRKLESLRAAENGTAEAEDSGSNLTRLPRRPRRATVQPGEHPASVWRPDGSSIYDPEPTRPVLRSELQRETGWFPVDPGRVQHPAAQPDPNTPESDASVIDLDALRRRRAGDDSPTGGIRRIAKPRRISPPTASEEATGADAGPTAGIRRIAKPRRISPPTASEDTDGDGKPTDQ